jgi:hypothetical protein
MVSKDAGRLVESKLTASTGLGDADNKGYINGDDVNAIDQNFLNSFKSSMMILMMMIQ